MRRDSRKDRPLFMISVAADLAGVHPQTLRIYERKQLICPQRSSGNTRLYSEADIERLRFIQHLTQDEGVNLAGVERIIELQREIERMRNEIEAAQAEMIALQRQAIQAARLANAQAQTGLVHVQRRAIVRRDTGL